MTTPAPSRAAANPPRGRKPAAELLFALRATVPVFLGYFAIGLAFGLLLQRSGYPWIMAPVMSLTIYAGAAQFLALGLFTAGAGLFEIAVATLLVNARHMVYGLSLLTRYERAGRLKPYLVFALTDETYAILTSVPIPPELDASTTSFYISMLDQSYWVVASLLGALAGTLLPVNTRGLDFALNALFMVLFIEQWKSARSKLPFVVAAVCGVAAYFIAGPGNMLIAAILAGIVVLLLLRKRLPQNG
ncbi:AzlC family ABC transporter permease [Salinispira pacifica]